MKYLTAQSIQMRRVAVNRQRDRSELAAQRNLKELNIKVIEPNQIESKLKDTKASNQIEPNPKETKAINQEVEKEVVNREEASRIDDSHG